MAVGAPTRIVGVDGCKAGWISVAFMSDDIGKAQAKPFTNFAELVAAFEPDSIIAVDTPIGLPDRSVRGGRAPDWAAREFLGPRRASVFPVPSRRAIYAFEQGFAQACAIARATSDPPKAPSMQAFSIFPRIQQIDLMLRRDPALRRRVFEAHPEVSFALMNGGASMPRRKSRAAFMSRACGFAKTFWRSKALLWASSRRSRRAGRRWTIFTMLALAPGAGDASSPGSGASFRLSRATTQKDCR